MHKLSSWLHHNEALQVVSWHPSAGELQLLIRHVAEGTEESHSLRSTFPTDTKHPDTHAHQEQGLGYIWLHVQYLFSASKREVLLDACRPSCPEGPKAGDLQPGRWVEIRGWDKHYIGQHIRVTQPKWISWDELGGES